MSFLQPGAAAFHPARSSDGSQRRPRKGQSVAALSSAVSEWVKDPVGTIGGFITSHCSGRAEPALEELDEDTKRQVLGLRMKVATVYDEWKDAAMELDQLECNDAWKLEKNSSEYDVALVESRIQQLDDARLDCDLKRMLFLVRTSLTRSLGGMGDLRLYKHSHIGTKALIEQYIESTTATIAKLLEVSEKQRNNGIEARHVLEQLLAARQAFGRSALLLSGGGTFGMNHIGVVKALWEHKLLPRIVSGASAGSIVASVLCTKTDLELPDVIDEFCTGELDVFEKEGEDDGPLRKAARFLKYGSLYDIGNLVRVMKGLLGDLTFQEAYNRTRRILNICVSAAGLYELPSLLNYITAPNVIIWSAVAASCSVPVIFSTAQLLAKDPRTGIEVPWNECTHGWMDGSVDNDLPMTRLAEMFNVNHFIVSQVNPHVIPFLIRDEDTMATGVNQSSSPVSAGPSWLHIMASLAKGEALHRMHVLSELGIFPNYFTKMKSVLSQKYSGDITILPEISYTQFPKILKNPTPEFMLQAMLNGERATWPKLSRVQNHCAIELALDEAVQKLRARVVFSPSQVDLRLHAFTSAGVATGTPKRRKVTKESRGRRRAVRSFVPDVLLGNVQSPDEKLATPAPWHHKSHSSPSNLDVKISSSDTLCSSQDGDIDDSAISSDTEDEDGDSTSTASESPPSPHPNLWPSARPMFSSISQPVTPGIATSRSFVLTSPTLTMTPRPRVPSTAAAADPSKRHTVAVPAEPSRRAEHLPSGPEITYKRLFHGRHVPKLDGTYDTGGDSSDGSAGLSLDLTVRPRRSGEHPRDMQLDISGTRGMMARRRRSLSTGLKELQPPTRQ